jgi:hypothetical protein
MRAEDRLVLNIDDFSQRTTSLFQRMNESLAFRQLFIKDPSGILAETMLPSQQMPASAVNQANRLLYSLLSNAQFMEWARNYQTQLVEQVRDAMIREGAEGSAEDPRELAKLMAVTFDRQRVYGDLTNAILEHVDRELLYSLLVADSDIEEARSVLESVPSGSDRNVPSVVTETLAVHFDVAVSAFYVLFFMVLTQVDLTPVNPNLVPEDAVSRVDLQRLSDLVADRLRERGEELRASGELTSLDAANRGSVL